jgi:hypothetical protein
VTALRARARARGLRRLAVAAAIVLVALGWLAAPAALLMAAPALALVLTLVAGWMPGEATIARWRSLRARPRPRRASARTRAPRTSPVRSCSRIVICFALANRPPPARRVVPG